MPKISVVMPAYNAEKYIAEAIDSILGQTFTDFEFIIINDCSRDQTEEIILSYDDPRIVYLKNEQNMGVAVTLNKGLAIAQGEYIARMDADDISLRSRFEKQVVYLENHVDVAVLGGTAEIFDENGRVRHHHCANDPGQMKIDMLFACGIAHPSVMMRRSVICQLGGYDPAFNGLEDYELWCRVLEKHEITALADVLLRYRIHSSQVTKNPSTQYKERMRNLKLWQAERLGISAEDAEAFARFALEGYPETLEQIFALDRFFVLAYDANKELRGYDEGKLSASFRAVMENAIMGRTFLDQRRLLIGCRFINVCGLLRMKIKHIVISFFRKKA